MINTEQTGSSFSEIDKSSKPRGVRWFTAKVKAMHSTFLKKQGFSRCFQPLFSLTPLNFNIVLVPFLEFTVRVEIKFALSSKWYILAHEITSFVWQVQEPQSWALLGSALHLPSPAHSAQLSYRSRSWLALALAPCPPACWQLARWNWRPPAFPAQGVHKLMKR